MSYIQEMVCIMKLFLYYLQIVILDYGMDLEKWMKMWYLLSFYLLLYVTRYIKELLVCFDTTLYDLIFSVY